MTAERTAGSGRDVDERERRGDTMWFRDPTLAGRERMATGVWPVTRADVDPSLVTWDADTFTGRFQAPVMAC